MSNGWRTFAGRAARSIPSTSGSARGRGPHDAGLGGLGYQAEGRNAARLGDPLHLAGCMLFWAEGSKRRNVIHFTNSDPRMLVFFRAFLVGALGVPPAGIHLTCLTTPQPPAADAHETGFLMGSFA
jgi:hypothetical protein